MAGESVLGLVLAGSAGRRLAPHLDRCAVQPVFNLYNDQWPILTSVPPLSPGVRVEPGAVVENAILDKNVVVRSGAAVGVSAERDAERGFTVSAGGVTVVGKGRVVEP